MRTAGVILAGGQSSRMGREKAFTDLDGRPLLSHVLERLSAQVDGVAINANGDAARFSRYGLPVIPDVVENGNTPLRGLHAALCWADQAGYAGVVTVTSDVPFIPRDLSQRLCDGALSHVSAVAASGGLTHFTIGLWRTGLRDDLRHFLVDRGKRRAWEWVAEIDAVVVDWPAEPFDPFFNINTPEDLAEARRLAAEFET